MFELIAPGIIAACLIFLYFLINKPDAVSRILSMKKDNSERREKIYLERFREHKQSSLSRNIIVQALPWLLVLAIVFILGNQYLIFAAVVSGSMMPTVEKGDLVLMQTFSKDVSVGDIVMFGSINFKEPIVHRVIGYTSTGLLVTKGDANINIDNEFIPPERIGGKAIQVGKKPIVLKGLAYVLRPQTIGEFKVLSRLPKNYLLAQTFDQFRTIQPLIIFFGTIFYFFILMESRLDTKHKFDNKGKNIRNGKNRFPKAP